MNNLFLYIIGAVPNGPVKIGVSNNVEKRLLALQTGFHLTLSVIKKWKVQAAGAYRIEKLSHIQLHEHRLQGEWFSCSSKDAIKEIELILVTTKKGKDFSKYTKIKPIVINPGSLLGGQRNAAKWKEKVKGGIEKARPLWVLPSKQYSIKDIEEISGIARGTIVKALGNRVPAQIAYQAAQKRKERRNAKR